MLRSCSIVVLLISVSFLSKAQCDPPVGLADSTFIVDLCPDTAVYNKAGNPASIGDTIYEWHSIDSNNWVFKNTRNDRRPVLDTNDGYRYLRFENGAFLENDLVDDSINGLNQFSIYTVVKSNVTGTDKGIFYWKYPPDNQDDGLCLRYDDAGANTGRDDVIKTGLLGNTPGNQIETNSNTQTTDRQVISITWSDGDKLRSYLNGSTNDSSNNDVGGPMNGVQSVVIGKGAKDDNAGESWDGFIGRTIFYNDEHPSDTVKKISDALPIELLSFDAELRDGKVAIEWRTATETRNDYFTVERSKDGKRFNSIEQVDGAGTSTSPTRYSVTDDSPQVGVNYYRLNQTDFDGKTTNSEIVAVRFAGGKDSLKVYPNPVKRSARLKVGFESSKEQEVLVVLRNIHGERFYSKVLVTDKSGPALTAIDLQNKVPSGIYFVTASSNDAMYRRKVVIE
jgi:hypothetical protein